MSRGEEAEKRVKAAGMLASSCGMELANGAEPMKVANALMNADATKLYIAAMHDQEEYADELESRAETAESRLSEVEAALKVLVDANEQCNERFNAARATYLHQALISARSALSQPPSQGETPWAAGGRCYPPTDE